MTDESGEKRINEITFNVLKWRFGQNQNDKTLIETVEQLIERDGRGIVINYKHKETRDYKLNIGFQIAPIDKKSKIVIEYLAKKNNTKRKGTIDLNHYEDIYLLVDRISKEGEQIILQPNKSYRAELVTKEYTTPLTIEIEKLQPTDG